MLKYDLDMGKLRLYLEDTDTYDPNLGGKELAFKEFAENSLIDVDDYSVDDLIYYLDHMDELMDKCYARDFKKNEMISRFSKIKPRMQNRFWF